jgi:hypothetical protein
MIIAVPVFILLSGCGGCDYTVSLTWAVPSTNTNGTPLTDLAGYELLMGPSSGNYTRKIIIPAGDKLLSCEGSEDNKESSKKQTKCSYTLTGLQQGSYYFVISAYNAAGEKSVNSNEVNKTASCGNK